ncbi:TetR/AcrR family transcriptional regulator [Aurantivibrio infirmus]
MPYSKSHKNQTRRRIMENAYRLFIENGYEAITIKQIMEASELTHGAFYAHFSSKKELFTLAILKNDAATETTDDRCDANLLADSSTGDLQISAQRLQSLSFASKIFRDDSMKNDPTLRSAYTQAFKSLCKKMLDDHGSKETETVLPMAAMLIGAETLAQTVDDLEIRDKLIESCKRQAELLVQGGQKNQLNNYFWELAEPSA